MNVRKLRTKLAEWLQPKTIKVGEHFTIVRLLRDGVPTQDGSWVGETLLCTQNNNNHITFSKWSPHSHNYNAVNYGLIIGVNCEVKPIDKPLTDSERETLYSAAKNLLPH